MLVARLVVVMTAIALLTVAAAAQQSGAGGINGAQSAGRAYRPPEDPKVDPAKQKADEKAYKDGLNRVPPADKKFDPWGTVRQSGGK